MAIFTCRAYPQMSILVKAEEHVMGAGGIVKIIPPVWKQFNKGRLQIDDADADAIAAIRQNVDFGNMIKEVNLKDLEAFNKAKSDADDTSVSCPYCLAKFDSLRELMTHSSNCKERQIELSSNAKRGVRGVQTTAV